MERTITVCGTGMLRLKPDWTEISMTLRSMDKVYEIAAEKSAAQLDALRRALSKIGFSADDLKTGSFRVDAVHEGRADQNGEYRDVFIGYACVHELKLGFALDAERLGAAIGAIAGCVAEPELYVGFSVRDRERAADEVLRSAAANARAKAELLAKASGVELGELVSIHYGCREADFASPSTFRVEPRALRTGNAMKIDMNPEDSVISDTAEFVWTVR